MTGPERLDEVTGESMEIIGELGRRHAEALALEIRQLAKRHGLEVRCRILAEADTPRGPHPPGASAQ